MGLRGAGCFLRDLLLGTAGTYIQERRGETQAESDGDDDDDNDDSRNSGIELAGFAARRPRCTTR